MKFLPSRMHISKSSSNEKFIMLQIMTVDAIKTIHPKMANNVILRTMQNIRKRIIARGGWAPRPHQKARIFAENQNISASAKKSFFCCTLETLLYFIFIVLLYACLLSLFL